MPKRRPPAPMKQDRFFSFPLPGLLPKGSTLVLSERLSILTLFEGKQGEPQIMAQELYSLTEGSLIHPLLQHYPHYCPYDVLFASFYSGSTTEKAIERARERLDEATFAGADAWDHEMRPIRNVLSRVRLKLKSFHIDIRSLLETGYTLIPRP